MKVRLCDIQHGDREIPLEKLPALVGRGPDAEIRVLDRFASRHHCEISEKDGTLYVRDLGSMNGSFVNGRFAKESSLRPGDTLSIGATTFVVSYETSNDCQIDRPQTAEGIENKSRTPKILSCLNSRVDRCLLLWSRKCQHAFWELSACSVP